MPTLEERAVISTALSLRRLNPELSACTVLDQALRDWQLDELPLSDWSADASMPRSPFGHLLVEAFDAEMSVAEWTAYSAPGNDAELRTLIMQRWRDQVIAGLRIRHAQVQAQRPRRLHAPTPPAA